MLNRVLAVIPAYNEEANLEKTLAPFLCDDPIYDYVVVNDGSSDGTRELCRARGWNMIDLPINTGLTYAVKAGMLYAYERGYQYAIQFDADGQHDFDYIAVLYEAVRGDECDIAIGTRFLTQKRPLILRAAGSGLISLIIKASTGQKLTDPTSGMRLFNRRMIELYARFPNINPEPDTIGYLMRCGIRVKEFQVEMRDRTEGESKFSFGSSIEYMIKIVVSLVFVQWFRRKGPGL